jgi:hypothetical protein
MQSMLPGWLVGRAVVSIFTASNESINQSTKKKEKKHSTTGNINFSGALSLTVEWPHCHFLLVTNNEIRFPGQTLHK